MEKLHRPLPNRRDILFSVIAAAVIALDQLTKWLIVHYVPNNTILWDWHVIQIVHIQNTGVSFGLLSGHIILIIIVVFLEMAVLLYIVYLLRNRLASMDGILIRVGLGLVMGGAIGNQIDRLAQHYVTDFIDWKIWPVSNIADICAVTGIIIIAYCIIFKTGLLKSKHGE